MCFLCVLGLILVHARRLGHIGIAVKRLDRIPRCRHGLGRHVDAIRPHVGDVTRLVESLRGAHGLARTHSELAAGFLLQGRGHEGGCRVAIGRLGLDTGHRKIAAGDGLHRHLRLCRIFDVESFQLFTGQNRQARLELLSSRGREHGFHGPVLACAERFDLHLAFYDHAQGDRLHTPC